MEFEIEGPFPAQPETSSAIAEIDRSRINAVEGALEERLVSMLANIEDVVSAEDQVDAAKAIGILFGCWRSMQPELDRASYGESPFAPLAEAVREGRRKRTDDPGEGEEEADGDEAG